MGILNYKLGAYKKSLEYCNKSLEKLKNIKMQSGNDLLCGKELFMMKLSLSCYYDLNDYANYNDLYLYVEKLLAQKKFSEKLKKNIESKNIELYQKR